MFKPNVGKFIDRVDAIQEKAFNELESLPQPDECGNVRINYQKLRSILSNRSKLGWCNGVYTALAYFPHEKK